MLEKFNRITKTTRYAAAVVLALAASGALLLAASKAAARIENTNDNGGQKSYGLTSGVVGITAGQTARLVVYNKGDKDELVRLQFIDANGQVLILCDSIVKSGKALGENFTHPGGANRVELRAEVIGDGTSNRSIGLLVPTVQVLENETGKTTLFNDSSGFAEFRALPNPPLVGPDN
jgi:hypothetical protein